MIKILGRYTSVNVQTVRWALAEMGIAHEQVNIGGTYGGNDTADYLAMNPNGLVPVMIDSDVTMFESAAIVRYVAAKYGDDDFYPKSPEIRAPLDMWAEWMRVNFYPVLIGTIFHRQVRFDPTTWDHEELAQAYDDMGKYAKILDARLSEGPFIGGSYLTFADIIIGALLYRYFDLDFPRVETPNLKRYYEGLTARETYQQHMMVSYESLKWRPSGG